MSELCQTLPFATVRPVSQAWQGRTPAVADLKGFPVYTLLLGMRHKFTMPVPEDLVPYQTSFTKAILLAIFQNDLASYTMKTKNKMACHTGLTTKALHTYGSNDYERGVRIL